MKIKGKRSRTLGKKCLSNYIPPESVKLHFQEYCRSSTIHGVRYFGEDNRPIVERMSWVLFFLVSIVCNAYSINNVWKKWNESPIIVTFAETTTPVWDVPFPAVTICSEVKSRSRLFNFTASMDLNETDYEGIKLRGDVSLYCDDHVICDGEDYVDDSTIEFLTDAAPPFLDTIFLCLWNGTVSENCSDIFTKVVTDEGICYSFNMLDKQDLFRDDVITYSESDDQRLKGWSQDYGYPTDSPLKTYPNRAMFSGTDGGLFIVLKENRNDHDFYCKAIQGFKMLLHNPSEFPMLKERFIRIPLGQEVIAVVQPNIMTANNNLRDYTPQQKQCYFQSERHLGFFQIYNQPNCEMECLTNYTLSECGCVALHMPRKGDTKICGPGKKKCMIEAASKLRISRIVSPGKNNLTKCDCLPACSSTVYNAESSQADFPFHAIINAYGENLTEFIEYDASRLVIYFKDSKFTTYIRNEDYETSRSSLFLKDSKITTSERNKLYGVVDFVASVGGLLGLFCGVSIISVVEFLYFLTVRFWGNLRAFKEANKKTEQA